jgi:outer membrane lipopolysaccharide assembly protein LptE/RlpB
MNGLKNEIAMQSSVLQVTKENRDVHNRGKDIKEVKRNYEDAMKLILEKDDEISMLRKELYEKE